MPLDATPFTVFPLFPITIDGACGCKNPSCENAGKHPQYPWSKLEAGEKIGALPGAGHGIATGSKSGLFVLDLDVRPGKDGIANFIAMGPCEATFTVRTPTGGLHLYFRMPNHPVRNSAGELGVGIDIRGDGGYVVAPGSPHKGGGTYTIAMDVPIADAPEWLLRWPGLVGRPTGNREPGVNAPIPCSGDVLEERLLLADAFCEKAEGAVAGANGSLALWNVARHLVRFLELPLDVAYDIIATEYNPKCQPPWTTSEIWHKLEDARDQVETLPGPPPEGLMESMSAMAQSKVVRETAIPGEHEEVAVGVRRVKDPKHVYSFTPGEGTCSAELGKLPSTEVAFLLSAHEKWRGVLQYDLFRRRIWAVNPPLKLDAETGLGMSDNDIASIRMWFQANGVTITKEDAFDAINAAARRCSYHPIVDYLKACKRVPGVLDNAAQAILGTSDEFANDFLRKTMIAAVRRITTPGVKFDNMLVLYGPNEGEGKTLFSEILFGEDFYRSQMPNIDSKDASGALQGYWGVEFAELHRILDADDESCKEFLSRRVDDFRPPYGRCEIHAPRSCVFIGTTNDGEFLRAAGRNRRWWPVAVGAAIDLDWLRANRDAMWGEALFLAEQQERHWHTAAEEVALAPTRQAFAHEDFWHDDIREYLQGRKEVTVQDIYEISVARGVADKTRVGGAEQKRIVDSLKRLGCRQSRNHHRRFWLVPEELRAMPRVNLAQRFADRIREDSN